MELREINEGKIRNLTPAKRLKELLRNEQDEIRNQTGIFISIMNMCKLAGIKYDYFQHGSDYSIKTITEAIRKIKKVNFIENFKIFKKYKKGK